jgi:SPP1 family predicted phage head-tail adaptor
MDRSTPIYLVTKNYTQNNVGVWSTTTTEKKVYAQVDSVTSAEWFEGGRNGLNPQYRFSMFSPDYNGEDIVKYNGKYYAVYRTYRAKNEIIELYTEEQKGTDDGK